MLAWSLLPGSLNKTADYHSVSKEPQGDGALVMDWFHRVHKANVKQPLRKPIMYVGVAAIVVLIGLGLHGLILKSTSLPPPPCHSQYTEWHNSIYK